jgi:hypothetical protein
MLAALPAPMPVIFVGVFTLMKMMSASRIASSMLVEKKRFLKQNEKRIRVKCGNYGIITCQRNVLSANRFDDGLKPGLVNRQAAAVPGCDLLLSEVHHSHLDIGAVRSDHGHGGSSNVAGSHTADFQRVV